MILFKRKKDHEESGTPIMLVGGNSFWKRPKLPEKDPETGMYIKFQRSTKTRKS